LAHLSNGDNLNRAQSIWINLGSDNTGFYAVKDETGKDYKEIPKAGHYIQVIKPIRLIILEICPDQAKKLADAR